MKKIKLYGGIFLGLAVLGFILQALGLAPKTEIPEPPNPPTVSVQSPTDEVTEDKKEDTSEKDEEEPTEKVNYDITEINIKVAEWFEESRQFHQEGHDGYEWTPFILDIKLKDNGAVNTIVADEFMNLTDNEKTDILNSVSRTVNVQVFLKTEEDKPYYITAYDQNGNKVARSRMFNVLKYKFFK